MTKAIRISIITPCFNARALIRDTVASVLGQRAVRSGRVGLEYLIRDGGSTDGTVEFLRGLDSPVIRWVSEPDAGMYDALAKGLSTVTGDVVAYLNAGDYYHPHAFDVIADIFDRPAVSWLTGYTTIYNEHGAVTNVTLPFRYRATLFECGAYGRLLPIVQQESTFWRRELHDLLDLGALARLRYAGDTYLWTVFSRRATLHVVQAALGGFRFHAGQISENRRAYRAEVRSFTRSPGLLDLALAGFDRMAWYMPRQVKKYLNKGALLQYDHKAGRWH